MIIRSAKSIACPLVFGVREPSTNHCNHPLSSPAFSVHTKQSDKQSDKSTYHIIQQLHHSVNVVFVVFLMVRLSSVGQSPKPDRIVIHLQSRDQLVSKIFRWLRCCSLFPQPNNLNQTTYSYIRSRTKNTHVFPLSNRCRRGWLLKNKMLSSP